MRLSSSPLSFLCILLALLAVDVVHSFSPIKSIKKRLGRRVDMPAIDASFPGMKVNGANGSTSKRRPQVDRDLLDIFAQNEKWVRDKEAEDPNFFKKLGSGHNPSYMWIGCADARVPANEIMGEDAGSVFVVRNVANLVVNTDFNLMSALQYAVNVLKVPHIIVCGHYDCGGVRASMELVDHVPPLENWLRNIRDV
jgi:carbonic anhydrase